MTALLLAVVLAFQNPAAQQRDTRTWYQAYDDAKKDIAAGRWQSALTNLQRATAIGPKPSRSVPTYGDVTVKFVPDYYLGIVYLNLKQYAQADASFQAVQASGLIGPRDSEYRAFTQQQSTAAFEVLVARADEAINAKQYDEALKDVQDAKGRADKTGILRIDALMTRINEGKRAAAAAANPPAGGAANPPAGSAANPPAGGAANPPAGGAANPPAGAPANQPNATTGGAPPPTAYPTPPTAAPGLPGSKTNLPSNATDKGPDAGRLLRPTPPPTPPAVPTFSEDTAIAPYFAGDYAQAVSALTALINGKNASPRVFFYLACSEVALVFTGRADESLLKDAKAALGSAGNPNQFAAERRYISPRILRQLGITP